MFKPDIGLPSRSSKPRVSGRTNLIDKGVGLALVADIIESSGDYIDLVKLGWGTAMVDPVLERRVEMYKSHGIDVCFGGTLFELFQMKGMIEEYASWLASLGVEWVEVSDGTIALEPEVKKAAITRLQRDFKVVSEVGSKDSSAIIAPAKWVTAIKAELEAGASYVILEGRESGPAGLYRPSGEIRMGLIEEVLDAGIPAELLVFEAPTKTQQTYMIDLIGPEVNLGNVAIADATALETLRLGLRSDTLMKFHGRDDQR